MSQSIHGHDILRLLVASDAPHTRASLAQALTENHGEGLEFHTCSREGLSLEQILGIFLFKGRVQELDGKLVPSVDARGKVCEHED